MRQITIFKKNNKKSNYYEPKHELLWYDHENKIMRKFYGSKLDFKYIDGELKVGAVNEKVKIVSNSNDWNEIKKWLKKHSSIIEVVSETYDECIIECEEIDYEDLIDSLEKHKFDYE